MITYVLTFSKTFPTGHPKAGQPTFFREKILKGVAGPRDEGTDQPEDCERCKIHTIRKNHDLWLTRIIKVQEGKAQISLRYWEGIPYRSKQITFCNLTKNNNVGWQHLILERDPDHTGVPWEEIVNTPENRQLLAENDGLDVDDFTEWFFPEKGKNQVFFGIIIHFTAYRYIL